MKYADEMASCGMVRMYQISGRSVQVFKQYEGFASEI
jgi:hypothetical protein